MTTNTITTLKPPTDRRAFLFKQGSSTALRYLVLILIGLFMLVPFILAFLGTFKTCLLYTSDAADE